MRSPVTVPPGEPSSTIILISLTQYLGICDEQHFDTILTISGGPFEAFYLIGKKFIVEYRYSKDQQNQSELVSCSGNSNNYNNDRENNNYELCFYLYFVEADFIRFLYLQAS